MPSVKRELPELIYQEEELEPVEQKYRYPRPFLYLTVRC